MKRGFNLVLGLVFVVLFVGFVSSLTTASFSIGTLDTCDNANKIIMRMSSSTNAHGEIYSNTNYNIVLCSPVANEQACDYYCSGESTECDSIEDKNSCEAVYCNWKARNKIIGLSSETNAHAEGPSQYNYDVDICYGDLSCVYVNLDEENTCSQHTNGTYPIDVLSLSSFTNAHIGAFGDYPIKVCCADGDVTQTCSTMGGTFCEEGTYCDEPTIPATDGDCCLGSCLEPRAYWANRIGPDIYEEISSIKASLDETEIYLVLENSGQTSGTLNFKIYEKDLGVWPNPDDLIKTISATIGADGKAIGTWIMTQADIDATGENDFDDFYFKEEIRNVQSNDLTITVGEFICIGIESCRDAKNSDDCTMCDGINSDVAKKSVFDNFPEINCDGINYNCDCYWDGDSCESEYMPIAPNNEYGITTLGKCQSSENSDDTCDDGLLSYSWTSTWIWDLEKNTFDENPDAENFTQNGGGKWHFDPINETTGKRKNEGCVGGSNTVVCPSQIQLPFFSAYNLVIAIVLIVLIYFLILKNSKKKSRKKKKTL